MPEIPGVMVTGVQRMFLAGFLLTGGAAARGEAGPFDYRSFLKQLRIPDGFTIELAAGAPDVRFPMFACLDDAGRLYVAESSGNDLYAGLQTLSRDCRVSLLEDSDGDGALDRAAVFWDGVTFPMGIAWREGRLYLADPPELIALTDVDGDGRADRQEVILSGFGHTDNGSLHGLTFGPDGLLYFTMGTPDGWRLPRGDGSFLVGSNGALFRCRRDGSRLELVSRGFVNLVEVEFLPGGEIIGTDNWYQLPAGGFRDALVDCAPGGLFPYEPDRGTPLPRTGITLPPVILTAGVAHSGIVRMRGDGFPKEWGDSLFVAEHNTRKVVRHELRRSGSTFAATAVDFATGEHPDFHPSDVLEDSDGSLLIVDTGGWYVEHCPTGRIRDSRAPGGIYRIRWKGADVVEGLGGHALKLEEVSGAEVVSLLDDRTRVAADRAAAELVRRGDAARLIAMLGESGDAQTRLRVLWALAQIPGAQASRALTGLLDDGDPEVVMAAARALALREEKEAGDALAALLGSGNPAVRRVAAETLAVCGGREHCARLAAALVAAGDDFEEHACIAALHALADETVARDLLMDASPRARRAALHLLDQPPIGTLVFADLVFPLGDADALLREAARRLLEGHPDWAEPAVPWLRERLQGDPADTGSASAMVPLIEAFQKSPGVRDLITDVLDGRAGASDATRALLLSILPSLMEQPPEPEWLRVIPDALANPDLRASALGVAMAYPRAEWKTVLAAAAEDPGVPAAERLLAARAATGDGVLSDAVFELALASLQASAGPVERMGAVDVLSRVRLTSGQLLRVLATLASESTVSPDMLSTAFSRSISNDTRTALAAFYAGRLEAGWSPPRAAIEEALAAFPDDSTERKVLFAAWETNNSGKLERLREFAALLKQGDAGRGREWFTTATCAGCHRTGAYGGELGPDLTKIGAIRSGEDLLESILYPSSTFAQGYEPYRLTRSDGEELFGSLVQQGPEGVTLRDAAGIQHRVPASAVKELARHPLSAMPEGLERLLTREQFGDLLAYLQILR